MTGRVVCLFIGIAVGAIFTFLLVITQPGVNEALFPSSVPPVSVVIPEVPDPPDLPKTEVRMVKGWSEIPGCGNGVIPIYFCQVEIEGKVATIVDSENVTAVYPPVP